MSNRVEARKQQTKQRIARAAFALFARKGIDETTVAEISEAADIGKGTFFTYFPAKEDVLAEVGTLLFERMAESVGEAHAAGPVSAQALIAQVLMQGIDWHEQNQKLSRLSVAILMRHSGSLDARDASIEAFAALLEQIVRAGQEAKEFRADVDVQAAVKVLLGLYFMSIVLWHQGGAVAGSLEPDVRAGIELIVKGLAA